MHMNNARRAQPTPIDFEYVFACLNLPLASLEPHLKPPVPISKTRVHLEEEPVEEKNSSSVDAVLGKELSGESEKRTKRYIPGNFPSFPSKHTYKWTEKESTRVTDPRQIREEAAKAARQGEEALRRLVNVGKNGKEKNAKKAASKDPRSKARYNLWEATMRDLASEGEASGSGEDQIVISGEANKHEDRSMIVNAERRYYRKGALTKKKPPSEPMEILSG